MAAKVNVKFIGIVFVVLSVAGGIVGTLAFLQYKGDAARNVRTGDEAMEAGDYRLAREAYGRAVFKEQTNREYLQKFERALLAYQPVSRDEARECYQEWMQVLVIDALYRGSDPTTHQRLIEELIRRGTLIDSDATWRQVETSATQMWDVVPAENPDRILAKFYRGVAVGHRISVLSTDEMTRGEDDLEGFLEARPESDGAWGALTMMRLAIAERYRAEGRTSQYQEKLKQLRETRQAGLEAVPGGFEMAMANARVLAYFQVATPGAVSQDELDEAVGRIVDLAETTDNRLMLLQYVQLMRELNSQESIRAAVDLLRSRVEDDPQAIFEHLGVARGYLLLDDLEETERFAKRVIDGPRLSTSLVSQAQFDLRREASRLLLDSAVRRWDAASAADKPAMMERVNAARAQLDDFTTGESDHLQLWADGRIALIEGDFETAAVKFDQYLKQRPETDLETMMLSAKALEEIKQYGGAYERIRQISHAVPNNVAVLVQRARLEYNIGRRTEALATLDHAEKISPGNPAVADLRDAIAERQPGAVVTLSDDEEINALLLKAREALESNDADGARELLRKAEERAPNDLTTLKMWFNLEVAAGNLTDARALADKARAVAPNDQDLLRVTTLLSHEDPIEAIKEYVSMTHEDEGERVVATMVNMRALAAQQQARAQSSEAAGDQDAATKARELAARAQREADALVARAEELAPDNRTLIEHQFVRATLQRNWGEAARIVDRAAKANVDRAGGAVYKGRLDLARGNFEDAVRAFLPATEQLGFSSYVWRLLGMAYEGAGNIADARRAYERSYERNPNDLATLRMYCDLLVRIGDPTRAITMLRSAVNLLDDSSPVVEYWLGLEMEHGDVGLALKRRRGIYERSKENSTNALQLATLLGQVKPRRELIVDANGNAVHAGSRWDRLRTDEQRKILDDAHTQWLNESEAILTDLEQQGVRGLSIVNARARNALARNQADKGEKLLRDFVAEQEKAGAPTINAMLTLGQYLAEARRYEEARDVFVAARDVQDPVLRQADVMLGDLYFRGSRFEQAAEAYQRVVEAGDNPVIQQRLIECYIKTRKFDEASTALSEIMEDASSDYVNAMLEAAIAEGRGQDLFANGRKDEARREFDKHRAALDRATALAPSQPMPHVQRAISYLSEFRREKDASALDRAMSSLDTAAAMRADYPAVSIARADVLTARGNLDAAIGELGRLLQQSPESLPVRRRLIELLLDSGRVNEAGNMLLDATKLFPNDAIWFERLGDLKVAQNDVNAAEPMYAKAYEVDPTRALLAKVATARLRMVPPNPRGAADVLAASPDDINHDPALRGVLAEALHGINQPMQALEQMRLAYRQYREAIARGEIAPAMISQWYVQLRKLYKPHQLADAERFIREVAGEGIDVYDQQWIARIWADGGRDGIRRAIEIQQQALAACPKDQVALRMGLLNDLSLYYRTAGDISRSIEVMEQLIAEQPDNAMTLNNLAYLMAQRSFDIKKAVSYAERANELKPNDPNILDTLGFALMLDEQYPKAEEALRKSLDIFPMASTHLHMAQVLSRTNQPRFKVENAIRRAEELNPDAETRTEINAFLDDMRKNSP
jgi:tetratricopeptide (TPR) repeat protein